MKISMRESSDMFTPDPQMKLSSYRTGYNLANTISMFLHLTYFTWPCKLVMREINSHWSRQVRSHQKDRTISWRCRWVKTNKNSSGECRHNWQNFSPLRRRIQHPRQEAVERIRHVCLRIVYVVTSGEITYWAVLFGWIWFFSCYNYDVPMHASGNDSSHWLL